MPENLPYSPQADTPDNATPLTSDEYMRQYYYAQWQQYYAALWQQYYAQQQQLYGSHYRPAEIQQMPQPSYSHGGNFENLPDAPAEISNAKKEIFVSYSTKNPREAAFVCRKLEEAGMRCWIAPRDLIPGTNFADNIEAALDSAKLLVLILSRASASSPWVEGEVNTAFSAGVPILVYQIDDVRPDGALKVMIEKFPTLTASGNPETDAGTLIYNAMIFTGRATAPDDFNPSDISTRRNIAAPQKNPGKSRLKPPQNRTTTKPASKKRGLSPALIFVLSGLLWIILTLATAPLWLPLFKQ